MLLNVTESCIEIPKIAKLLRRKSSKHTPSRPYSAFSSASRISFKQLLHKPLFPFSSANSEELKQSLHIDEFGQQRQ